VENTGRKVALITGVTGQDGSYLTELLLEKGYEVHGVKRRSSSFNTQRLDHLYGDLNAQSNLKLHHGDMTDSSSISRLVAEIAPDEVYNLAAQSHVAVSFETPEYTAEVDALGTLRLLEAIRLNGLARKTKFYQASTSELYGLVQEKPQRESTPFYPRSPYAVAKMYSYWITVNYREAYGMYACNGILFNHESPRRGETFVTRKITRAVSAIAYGLQKTLALGNLDSLRDWGHARDFVQMQWMMLQRPTPKDYVIATGNQITVRDFCKMSAKEAGIDIEFEGSGLDEIGVVRGLEGVAASSLSIGDVVVRVDARYFRPTEVETLLGDSSLAKEELGWTPVVTTEELCREMTRADMELARKEKLIQQAY